MILIYKSPLVFWKHAWIANKTWGWAMIVAFIG